MSADDGVEDDDDNNKLKVASVDKDNGVEDEEDEDIKEKDWIEVLDIEGMGLTEPYVLHCCTKWIRTHRGKYIKKKLFMQRCMQRWRNRR
jgi:hypothetical protein